MLRNILLAAACALVSACAFSPQTADIAPTVNIVPSQVGDGVTVAVRVVDERPSKSLGRRGTAYGAAAEITAAQDLALVIQREVVKALEQKGFVTTDYSDGSDTRLTVEIRLLEYSTSQGFWTGGVHIQGTLKAVAAREGRYFDKIYRSSKEERVGVVPTAQTNEEWINSALGDVLQQMLDDDELIRFLVG